MRAIVVTTITTSVDLETFTPEHSVTVSDEDNLSEVSPDVLGAVLLGGLAATTKAMREKFPQAAKVEDADPVAGTPVTGEAALRDRLLAAFSGDEFEENAAAAAGEGEWSWFHWLLTATLDAALSKVEEPEEPTDD